MEQCLNMQEIAALAGLATDDPRRRHLESCPHCRGMAEALGTFLSPGDTSDLDDLAGADVDLWTRLAAAMDTPAAAPVVARPRRRRGWLALAAVLAVASLGLAAADLAHFREFLAPRTGERLRGEPAATDLVSTPVDDGLRLAWSAAPTAETFVFVFLAADLEDVGRLTSPAPVLEITGESLPAAASLCQVFAVAQGDTIARSAIVRLRPARE